ncbi:Arc/MetJ-type ribon-helix-helix transcriptional regulator [Neorhizobium galegae]|uniref:ribbon-helix-helix domain-containing protein n=1 Tax=Neorhizobium galegae TaxID=399 RepID=UPI001AEA4987|nr:type II toxin-antitoxin system ParD family antitoxin [Neorhizobium galegae]MBP2549450.1 Arc/MetJ-type ribon-helix-helix transcriptional regulator [Neorhizobium galegae]
MKSNHALTITLPPDLAEMVDLKVRSGEYASEEEVITESLRSLAAESAGLEDWINEQVLPTVDRLAANPSSAVPDGEAWGQIKAHMDQRRSSSHSTK